ncbi:MAG: type I-E CRISPR-associated protein Cas7/Cse4/CasC [Gammaproteobacteria bacterium]|nr:type I-E CRISPR-associated protein Cas7/Cse4/CasC [Gammaproteobacteria bacterium]MCF6259844.1 type I-E CRISPR-associated protein Cas7/Cse4/CasC [Gammaproteobacteria bacterium]
MKTIIEIHALQNYAPSNLNRDDTGAPKDALFGGSRRARISSQCQKHAVRKYFDEVSSDFIKSPYLADRTKRLLSELQKKLAEKGREGEEVEEKLEMVFSSMRLKLKDSKTEYLLFLGRNEVDNLASLIDEKWNEIGDPVARLSAIRSKLADNLSGDEGKLGVIQYVLKVSGDKPKEEGVVTVENNFDDILNVVNKHWDSIDPSKIFDDAGKPIKGRKKSDKGDWELDLEKILKDGKDEVSALGKSLLALLDGGKAVDLALFGRMLANMPEKNQHASCQVAHAISSHAVEREFDFYTAMDHLKPEDTAGADMMGTIEFNSACFYRYAVIDWEKLVENLQDDTDLAAKGLQAFLDGFVVAEPTGKQNSFAAHNAPEFVAVSVRRNTAPRNLANAFETAIRVNKTESLTKESATRLSAKSAALDKFYGTTCNARYVVSEDTFGERFDAKGLGKQEENVAAVIEWALSEVTKKGE